MADDYAGFRPAFASRARAGGVDPPLSARIPAGAPADAADAPRVPFALGWLTAAPRSRGLPFATRVRRRCSAHVRDHVGSAFRLALAAIIPDLVPRGIRPAVSLNGISINAPRRRSSDRAQSLRSRDLARRSLNAASLVVVILVLRRWRRELSSESFRPKSWRDARGPPHAPQPALRTVLVRTGTFVLPASAVWALLPPCGARRSASTAGL